MVLAALIWVATGRRPLSFSHNVFQLALIPLVLFLGLSGYILSSLVCRWGQFNV
jgi:hypothetical protein